MPWKECSVKDERLQSVTYVITHVPRAGPLQRVVRPERLELPTLWFEA